MTDWHLLPNFSPDEFPPGELALTSPGLLSALQSLRHACGIPIKPSPVKGGLARTDGSSTSRHYAVGRKSDAIDIFPKEKPLLVWQQAVRLFGGVGVYHDTKGPSGYSDVMLHVDMRPSTVWWCRVDGKYHAVNKSDMDSRTFYKWLATLAR